jgi:LuxR family maltose regulon positive regulatory protein
MPAPILATKLYIPSPRPGIVPRPRLVGRLNEGLAAGRKLALISASAGFGKTTLVSEWIAGCNRPVAWLSLEEGDNDPARFLAYIIAAMQTIKLDIGAGVLGALQNPQLPPIELLLTSLLNEITTITDQFILILDDYHLIDAQPIDHAIIFLIEHLPPQMLLVIATREDPHLPLARYRARGQLTELRAADLRFNTAEAAEFLNQVMGLNLSAEDIAALDTRTEGWIAGLQMAAISMQGLQDASSFIQSFSGSHRFVLDYLLEEVLHRQPVEVQTFLLRTSILERLCGPLCDAVIAREEMRIEDSDKSLLSTLDSQSILEYLERANLFIIPLDNERRWYRYHHLFAELLRQRLGQRHSPVEITEYHRRASQWYEDHHLEIEAFQHAAAAKDIDRAERLIESKGMPLHFRGVATMILDWLASLPTSVLDARPFLWVRFAGLTLNIGQNSGVEAKLQAAEAAMAAALRGAEPDNKTRDLIGQIAAARAILALSQYQVETIISQSLRALEYLAHDNLLSRFTANWAMGMAHHFRGEREAAGRAYAEALSIAQTSGNIHDTILATISLGQIQELDNQLNLAAETYQQALRLIGDSPLPTAGEVYRGLAQIYYEWNDLDAAERYGQQGLRLSQQYEHGIDRFIIAEVFLARLKLAQGDISGAARMLTQTEQTARQKNFTLRLPEIAAAQVQVLLKQTNLPAAAELARRFELPLSQARVLLAQGDSSAALPILESFRQQVEAKGWQDERLRSMVLQAVAHQAHGNKEKAMELLGEALAIAELEGFIRLFVDEGVAMVDLLSAAVAQGIRPDYVNKLLAAFEAESKKEQPTTSVPEPSSLVEPLSSRELEVLGLIAQGLSNQEICKRLFLALDTVKGHNRRIFEKLQVNRRTEAIARAHELGLL